MEMFVNVSSREIVSNKQQLNLCSQFSPINLLKLIIIILKTTQHGLPGTTHIATKIA